MKISAIQRIILSGCIALFALGRAPVQAEPLKVVTSLSTFASLVEEVGGEWVSVSSVAASRFNPHFIEPKPGDVLRLKRAQLFVHGGLDLEAWRSPLVDAAARVEFRQGGTAELDLSNGVRLLDVPTAQVSRAQGDIHQFGNPHYWLSPQNARVMVDAISARLEKLDSAHAEYFRARAVAFKAALREKENSWRGMAQAITSVPLVAYHDEWKYLFEFLGLRTQLFIEPKPGVPPSPQHLALLEKELSAAVEPGLIVQASYQPLSAADMLKKKTNSRVAVLCQSVGELDGCGSYIEMLDYNVRMLTEGSTP